MDSPFNNHLIDIKIQGKGTLDEVMQSLESTLQRLNDAYLNLTPIPKGIDKQQIYPHGTILTTINNVDYVKR